MHRDGEMQRRLAHAAGVVLTAAAWACTPATAHSPPVIPGPIASDVHSEGEVSPVAVETPAVPEKVEDTGRSEQPIAQRDFAAEWTWIQTRFADATEYRPVKDEDIPLEPLLSWARPEGTTTIYDRACRPIPVERKGEQLCGLINRQTSTHGNFKDVHADELLLDQRIVQTAGSEEIYRRTKNGRWKLESTGGIGEAHSVGLLLSNVTLDAAWYNGQVVQLHIACAKRIEEEVPCIGGGSRKCVRCLEWGIHPSSMEQGYAMGRYVPQTIGQATDPVDCSAPCPSAEQLPDDARRAQAALKGHEFVTEGPEEHPYLFRTRDACRRYRRAHPIPDGDLRTW